MLIEARINHKHPRPMEFSRKGWTAVDMHFHSRYSDGINKIDTIVNKAARLGIGVAVTDHNEINGCVAAFRKKKCLVVPGIEVTCKEGMHMLFYFYSIEGLMDFFYDEVEPYLSKQRGSFLSRGIKDILKGSKKYKCVVSAAHPYALTWQGISKDVHKKIVNKKLWESIDAVEVMNGANIKKRNLLAVELAKNLDKPITGGSDGHTLGELGNIVTYVKEEMGLSEFLDSIINKTNFVLGKETMLPRKLASQAPKIGQPGGDPVKYLNRGLDYLKHRMDNS